MIFDDPAAALAGAYPSRWARLRHRLAGHPLFALPALAELAARLPSSCIEYNAGDLPIDQDPDRTPMNGLTPEETVRRIAECGSWMVLKHVEQDAAFKALLEAALAEIAPAVASATGRMHRRIAFVFVSSPGAVTPLHMDPEHNILMQLEGTKRLHVYPTGCGLVSAEQHEAYHAGEAHRNLRHDPSRDGLVETIELAPGDGAFVPVKAPHWVKNGDAPSVSFSITWRSRASDGEARLRLANHAIRRFGGSPPEPGAAPLRDAAAILAQRAVSRIRGRG